jgi:hypothetical protein
MELGEKWPVNLACDSDFHVNRRVLLHAENLRNGTDGFTSPMKGRSAVDFFARKIRGGVVVEALRYKPESTGFDSRLVPPSLQKLW